MSSLPLIESILLEIRQSAGIQGYPTNKKDKFAKGQLSLDMHRAMGVETLDAVFDAFDMDPQMQLDAMHNLMEFANAYKQIELNTWTFAADLRQIVWDMLGYFLVPGLARRVAFWNLPKPLDAGMPDGRFWYLPEIIEHSGNATLYMPVAQVVDWLLDLLGMPLEVFSDQRSDSTDGLHEGLRRSLYNWRAATSISPDSIEKYFADDAQLSFDGAFQFYDTQTPAQQFDTALAFVKGKNLSVELLSMEIPMTQPGLLDAILAGSASEEEQARFVICIAQRYAVPSMKTIRQRFLLARTVQDGYSRLLKFLCPDIDRQCVDEQQNKVLQLFGIYKFVYNTTIGAWCNCADQGVAAENRWFEEQLPEWDKFGIFLSILPSRYTTANQELAQLLTRRFYAMQPGEPLECHIGINPESVAKIIRRNVERAELFFSEMERADQLLSRMQVASPWRALQHEQSYWVVSQIAAHPRLSTNARTLATNRLRELAASPAETVQAILFELGGFLNGERKQRPKDTAAKVALLLAEVEESKGNELWKAPILQFKAKHLLACNQFEDAAKCFREALDAVNDRNYGPVRGEIARDAFALSVANQKLIHNNHEKFYREMLAGGMMSECDQIPSIEDTARWVSDYFWETLYKPYPGVPAIVRGNYKQFDRAFKEITKLLDAGTESELSQWIKSNRQLLNSNLPEVDGNSVLMLLFKMRSYFVERLPIIKQIVPLELQGEVDRFNLWLKKWRNFTGQLAKEHPKQLNIVDIKGQTPLMLAAQAGDAELVKIMLEAGANPDLQDIKGMTALHSAAKSNSVDCVNYLLNLPCRLDLVTVDGRTPLHTATWMGNLHAVRQLIASAPKMAWHRDADKQTPLELAEHLIENPDEFERLSKERAKFGSRCATPEELEQVAKALENVAAVC
ncbi:Ribulose-5-phosphate 4-epimerase and related epimerases and aldolases [Shewanella baltica]|uniref:ankyrin repeat domain-containing protein n=1 Tax=Shewanella baltica TaxID=62322 RepID=UPI000F71D878|nr:ankyrin repeat domain-containing protein [Shewanella baltica]VEF26295.1 Ribulose-5-phosphate 4-epimerase and related epimerases and aldolases [Shewanella baltica]